MTGYTITSESTISNITCMFKLRKDEAPVVFGIYNCSQVESHLDDDDKSEELPDLVSLSGHDDFDNLSDLDGPHLGVRELPTGMEVHRERYD